LLTNNSRNGQIAILFDTNNPSSRDECKKYQIHKSITIFELPGDLKLVPILISSSRPERMASSKIAILTQ